MGRISGAVHGYVLFRDCESSGVPRAKAGGDDCDGLGGDDYVAIDMAKVRKFENGLKLSIRARIVGLRLQDMDSMVGTTLTIERELGLEVETLEEPLYMSSPLGIRARIRMIGRGCELEISGTLLTVDLRIMDMSKFDVILGMDWLIAYRIVTDCERMRVTAYTQDGTRVVFQGDKHDILSPNSIRVQVSGTVSGLASEPYSRGRGETGLRSTSSSIQVCGCFSR